MLTPWLLQASAPLFAAMLPVGGSQVPDFGPRAQLVHLWRPALPFCQPGCPISSPCGFGCDSAPDGPSSCAWSCGAGILSGALLQRYCPDHGQCTANSGSNQATFGLSAGPARLLLRRLASALAAPSPPVEYPCDGRAMWAIVGALTLSSPILVLLTQRWIRPSPKDFSRVRALHGCVGCAGIPAWLQLDFILRIPVRSATLRC